jgi:hypothetical protein
MQRLRGRGWVKAAELSSAPTTVKRLIEKQWIESAGAGMNLVFKITEEGMAAKRAVMPLRR